MEELIMKLESFYIECNDFDKSVLFYTKILKKNPKTFTKKRWVVFKCGNTISLYNRKYDTELIKKTKDINTMFNDAYLSKYHKEANEERKNNIITLNFRSSNLAKDYKRIKDLNIGEVSEIMYVNITAPYYYFVIKDPDGNELEIYGDNFNQ